MENETRSRMVESAASLISAHGSSATSLAEVIEDSGAPRGSIYHHFPDGKRELTQEAVRLTSQRLTNYLRTGTGSNAREVTDHFISLWRRVVLASAGARGCAVVAVALDVGDTDPGLMKLVKDSFRSWTSLFASQLEDVGVPHARARDFSIIALAAMEGALILCRAEGNVKQLDVVAGQLRQLIAA